MHRYLGPASIINARVFCKSGVLIHQCSLSSTFAGGLLILMSLLSQLKRGFTIFGRSTSKVGERLVGVLDDLLSLTLRKTKTRLV